MNTLRHNLVLDADSYKLSHFGVYPKDISGMFSYIEPRVLGKTIVPFGLQMWIQKTLLDPITKEDVDEAEAFAKAHGEPFNRIEWDYLIKEHGGFLPIKIRAVPEGLPVPSNNVIVTVECTDPSLFWLASYLETSLQRGVWYPTTIASQDYENWKSISYFHHKTADDMSLVPFSLHDFGGRGVSSEESAQIAGAAHLVYFMGSDTISGVRAANFYYDSDMAAFSVPATEHSIQSSWGPGRQREYLKTVLDNYAKPGAIVSIVIDGYDTFDLAEKLCFEFRQQIIDSGARIVFRPDSGDAVKIIPALLAMQERAFGFKVNTKGYKVINHVGIIQGDGIDHGSMCEIYNAITDEGYSASNIVFGSGGALLQKVNRDTFKFAQKASAILVNGNWVPIFKSPVTDMGKKSKAGRLTLVQSRITGEYQTINMDLPYADELVDVMQTVYDNGNFKKTNLAEVRERAMNPANRVI